MQTISSRTVPLRAHQGVRRRIVTRASRKGPIPILPAELLCDIFLYVRDSEVPLHHAPVRLALRMFSWLAVTKVCRYWRAVALNFHRLWSTLLVTDSPQFRIFFARAQSTQLSITCLHQLGSARSFATVLAELPRIQNMIFKGPKSWLDVIQDETSAPGLQYLSLVRTDNNVSANDICLPKLFTRGNFPQLQRLEISGYHVQWQNTVFCPTLRQLRITSWYGLPRTIAETVNALRSLPLLEDLDLHRMLPTVDDFMPPRPVTLAHLKHIRVTDNALGCARLLDCIICPGTANIILECHCFPGAPDSMPLISSAIRRKLLGTGSLCKAEPLVSLAVEQRSHGPRQQPAVRSLSVCGWSSSRTIEPLRRTTAAESANLRVLLLSAHPFTALDLCRDWPLESVRKLCFFSENCASEAINEAWMDITAVLVPKLTILSISGTELLELLPELLQNRLAIAHADGEAAQTRSGLSRTRPILPDLDTLLLPLDFERTNPAEEQVTPYALSLSAALRARKRAGVQIKVLIIPSCSNDGDHSELSKVVGQFYCLQCT